MKWYFHMSGKVTCKASMYRWWESFLQGILIHMFVITRHFQKWVDICCYSRKYNCQFLMSTFRRLISNIRKLLHWKNWLLQLWYQKGIQLSIKQLMMFNLVEMYKIMESKMYMCLIASGTRGKARNNQGKTGWIEKSSKDRLKHRQMYFLSNFYMNKFM